MVLWCLLNFLSRFFPLVALFGNFFFKIEKKFRNNCGGFFDPRPFTLDPRLVTLDPRLVTLDPRPSTLDPRP